MNNKEELLQLLEATNVIRCDIKKQLKKLKYNTNNNAATNFNQYNNNTIDRIFDKQIRHYSALGPDYSSIEFHLNNKRINKSRKIFLKNPETYCSYSCNVTT
jgi:hypothetical protein